MAIPHLRIRVTLANGFTLGPSRIALLEAVAATGSITAAARSLDISLPGENGGGSYEGL